MRIEHLQERPRFALVRAMQSGDESALNELIRKYQEPLFRFIWRYAGAELLGVSAKTVETRVYRARKRLENMLA